MRFSAWWFAPLVVGFAFLFIVINDLKHPKEVLKDQCHFVGKGLMLSRFELTAKWLSGKGGRPENNLGLQCQHQGAVMMNSDTLLPPNPDMKLTLVRKTFAYIPMQYKLYLNVENPDTLETASNKKQEAPVRQ